MDRQKKYIILTGGDGGTGNLGDQFILSAVQGFYKKYQRDFNIVILKLRPPKPALDDGFIYATDNEDGFKKLKIPVSDIALVHFYGGGYLNIYWYEAKIWLYRYLTKQGLSPKSVIFSGQGLGPFLPPQESEIQTIAKQVLAFGVRDIVGTQSLENSKFSFDETISLIRPRPTLPKSLRRNHIGMNLRLGHEHSAIEEAYLLNLLRGSGRFASSRGQQVYFFGMIKNDSYSETEAQLEIIEKSKIKYYKIYGDARHYKQLLRQFGASKLIITTSYHATLLALYAKVPVISVFQNEYYRLKFEGLQESLRSELLHVHRIDRLGPQHLESALNSLNRYTIDQTNEAIDKLNQHNKIFYETIARQLSEHSV